MIWLASGVGGFTKALHLSRATGQGVESGFVILSFWGEGALWKTTAFLCFFFPACRIIMFMRPKLGVVGKRREQEQGDSAGRALASTEMR